MNRKSSVDTGNPWLILTAAHDYLWRAKIGNFRDRFEATGLLWKLAIETGLAQHKEKAYVET